MTIGISKEALEEIARGFDRQNLEYACVVRSIISECTELDPWLPIDENTPKDRPLWLFNSVKCLAQWSERFNAWHVMCAISSASNSYNPELDFTHYKELPPDPTCENSAGT